MESDVKIYRSSRNRAAEAVPANAEVAPPPVSENVPPEIASTPLPTPEEVLAESALTPLPSPEEVLAEVREGQCEPPQSVAPPQTAAQALGLDITTPWIEPAEPLRRLFATQAPTESPLAAEGFVYVATVLPQGGDCLTGLRAAGGRITGIRYALPGAYAPEPPAGLEDYAWNDAGYWVLDIGVS